MKSRKLFNKRFYLGRNAKTILPRKFALHHRVAPSLPARLPSQHVPNFPMKALSPPNISSIFIFISSRQFFSSNQPLIGQTTPLTTSKYCHLRIVSSSRSPHHCIPAPRELNTGCSPGAVEGLDRLDASQHCDRFDTRLTGCDRAKVAVPL